MKYDTAIVDFNEVLNINPKHIDAFIFRGLCYFSKGDLTHAKSDLSSAIKLNNNDMTALYTRGIINIKLNNLKEAYEDLTKAETIGHPLSARAIKVYLKDYRPDDNKRTNQKPE
jgi:tetratricopeptide (TPR) repeat protein